MKILVKLKIVVTIILLVILLLLLMVGLVALYFASKDLFFALFYG